MLTIGIVTVPFMFEGDKKILKALDGANEMREHVDALLLINNENLMESYIKTSISSMPSRRQTTLWPTPREAFPTSYRSDAT